jgi:hypothetical protein
LRGGNAEDGFSPHQDVSVVTPETAAEGTLRHEAPHIVGRAGHRRVGGLGGTAIAGGAWRAARPARAAGADVPEPLRAEFRADAMAFFKTLDVNGDGRIDGFELSAYEHKIVPELIAEVETRAFGPPRPSGGARRNGPYGRERPRPEGGGEEGGGDASGRGHLALLRDPEPVSSADTDVDGRVSAAEWLAAADARFDLLDGKGADALTREAMANLLPKPGKPGKRR